jgi:hypothetical protein
MAERPDTATNWTLRTGEATMAIAEERENPPAMY